MKRTLLLPPPGPLAWLHPELHGLDRRATDLAARHECDDVWDGARRPFTLATLREAGPRTWVVPGGSRGETLVDVLRFTDVGEHLDAIREPWGIEDHLCAVAHAHPGAECLAFPTTEPGEVRALRLAEMLEDDARSEVVALPLRAGEGLAERLATIHDTLAARSAALVPFFVPDEADDGPRETRLLPSWRCLLPGDRYPADVREATRELIRRLHPDRALRFRAFEHYALAGIDLYAQSLAGRTDVAAPPPPPRPLLIAVCGIDGSGKSSHVAALREHLEAKGLRCAVHKIYRHGVFHATVTDLTRGCARSRNLHLWRIQRLAKAFDSLKYLHRHLEPDLATNDVVLFDRYLPTHFAAGTGRYHHDPYTRELLASFPTAHRVFVLDLPAAKAWERTGAREERTVDENPYMLDRFRQGLLDEADREGFTVLSSADPFDANQTAIRAGVDALLAGAAEGRG